MTAINTLLLFTLLDGFELVYYDSVDHLLVPQLKYCLYTKPLVEYITIYNLYIEMEITKS